MSQFGRKERANGRIIVTPKNESLAEDWRVRKINVFPPHNCFTEFGEDRFGKENERRKAKEGRLHPAHSLLIRRSIAPGTNRVLQVEEGEAKFRRLHRFENIANRVAVADSHQVTTRWQAEV